MNGNDFTSTSITTRTTVSTATSKPSTPPLTVQHDRNVDWIDDNDTNFPTVSIKDIYNENDRFYALESQSTPSSVVSSNCAASTNEYSNQDPNFASEEDSELKVPRPILIRSVSSSESQSFQKRRSRRKEPISEQRKFNIAMAKKLSPIAKYKEQMKKVKAKRNQRRKFSLIHSFENCATMKKHEATTRSSPFKLNYFAQPPASPSPVQSPVSSVPSLIPLPQPSAFYPPQQMYIVEDGSTSISQFPQEVIAYRTPISPSAILYSECPSSSLADPSPLRTMPMSLL